MNHRIARRSARGAPSSAPASSPSYRSPPAPAARELDAVYVWGAQTGGARRLGDDGFIQLTGAIGYCGMLSMTVNACELEAGQGAEVLQ